MPPCKHHEICGREALGGPEGDELCILHSENPQKDREAFREAFEEHVSRHAPPRFSFVVFPIHITFRGEMFEKARFQKAEFKEGASFASAEFIGEANFSGAKFRGRADFSASEFMGESNFIDAEFPGGASFVAARFSDRAWFISAQFIGIAQFQRARFTKRADFSGARFHGRTVFSGAAEKQGPVPIFSGIEVDFRHLIIDPLDALVFRDADLQKCRFLGTDLRKAEITAAKWPKPEFHLDERWPSVIRRLADALSWLRARLSEKRPRVGGRNRVYDEVAPLEEGEARQWSHIEHLYRQLKQNYEDRRDYLRAGDFHYGERDMWRKNPETQRVPGDPDAVLASERLRRTIDAATLLVWCSPPSVRAGVFLLGHQSQRLRWRGIDVDERMGPIPGGAVQPSRDDPPETGRPDHWRMAWMGYPYCHGSEPSWACAHRFVCPGFEATVEKIRTRGKTSDVRKG